MIYTCIYPFSWMQRALPSVTSNSFPSRTETLMQSILSDFHSGSQRKTDNPLAF